MDRKISLLLVDDDPGILQGFTEVLQTEGYEVSTAATGKEALKKLETQFFDLLLLDEKLPKPGPQGLDLLKTSREKYPDMAAIIITGYADVPLVTQAFKVGILDFIEKPVNNRQLCYAVKRALRISALSRENRYLRHHLPCGQDFNDIIGQSPRLQEVLERIRRVINLDVPVLIQGESGTGKELIARTLHFAGPRKEAPFVPVNITALSKELLESELFGHKKGAFTNAHSDRAGLFEEAREGTLFLDEIGDASLAVQHKLFRAIQESRIRRVGDNVEIPVDVRIVAATFRNLEELIKAGQFEEALYFRLSVFPIYVPPLRERREDIPLLVEHFLNKYGPTFKKQVTEVSQEALDILTTYDYARNNVRELENIIQQALILTDGKLITPDVLPRHLFDFNVRVEMEDLASLKFNEAKQRFEKSYIESLLIKTSGNIAQAARLAGMERTNFKDKMKKYHITAEAFLPQPK